MPNKEFKIFAQISFTVDFKQRGESSEAAKQAAINKLKEVYNLRDNERYMLDAENIDIDVEATDEEALENHLKDMSERCNDVDVSKPPLTPVERDEPWLCAQCGNFTVPKEGDFCFACGSPGVNEFKDMHVADDDPDDWK